MHIYILAYTYAHIYTYIYVYIYTHICSPEIHKVFLTSFHCNTGPNPLMVVNERSNIQTQPPAVARTGPTTIIEGNVAVGQQFRAAAPFGY